MSSTNHNDPLDELLENLQKGVDNKEPHAAPKERRLKSPELQVAPSPARKRWQKKQNVQKPPPDPGPSCLWSSRHKAAFKVSRLLLSRAPLLAVIIPLSYAMLANIIKGDYYFFIRWYRESWILPAFVEVVSSKQAFLEWFHIYGVVTMLIIMTIVTTSIVLYVSVYRILFKDYIRFSENVETFEGRAMWVEGFNLWSYLWDAIYSGIYRRKFGIPYKPDRRTATVFLKTRLFINPANPSRNLLKIDFSTDRHESLEHRGPFELIGHEGPYRRITGIRQFKTHADSYSSSPIPLGEATKIFQLRLGSLVKDTQKLTHANVGVRLDKMKSGTIVVDPEVRDLILDERQKRAQA